MNVDRWMRKISKMEYEHAKFSSEHINVENQYKALRTTIQKLKPLLIWFQGYEQNISYTKTFQKIVEKVGKSKTSVVEEKSSNFIEMGNILSENDNNLRDIKGFNELNITVRAIGEKKSSINEELIPILQRLEEAINKCKEIDLSRNICRDIQYKSERAYQKKDDYKFDSEFKTQRSRTFDDMKKFLDGDLGDLISDINSVFISFHNINESKE